MKSESFGPTSTGKLVPVSGAANLRVAFVPAPLPPNWEWPQELWPVLLEAHKSLASLDGTGKHLPNPELILRPLQKREAQKSSSLEGTYTDPQQQVLFELDPKFPASTDDPANAQREVFNYTLALSLRRNHPEDLPISLRLIKDLHGVLMNGVRGADKNPGEFRKLQNQIGRPARYVPPPANQLPQALDQFEKYLHAPKKFDPLVETFLAHYQFEAIHPFMDGNGRVGRLLLAILIADWCGLSNQWLYMSDYFDANKDEYIDRLFQVSSEGKWGAWIAFCLRGVVEQARDTALRYDKLIELNRDFHSRVAASGGSVRLSAIVDALFDTPVAVVTRVAAAQGVTYPTARSDLKKLDRLGILTRIGHAKQISYFCEPIFEVIYTD